MSILTRQLFQQRSRVGILANYLVPKNQYFSSATTNFISKATTTTTKPFSFFSTTTNNDIPLNEVDDDIPLNFNDDIPLTTNDNADSLKDLFSNLSNDELLNRETIPGWNLVHKKPRKYPKGALVGMVVSDKMNKTINVAIDRYRMVPKYRKRRKYTRKFMAHDENEVAKRGDMVMIVPSQKLSKNKHFMLREIIKERGLLVF
mmetsp:Transcript_26040/g.29792  ORF Transcript_26040/g.29792 Transcript_26040/m.29792 type:complete len:203 (+) Transcript_26040:156-764(+)